MKSSHGSTLLRLLAALPGSLTRGDHGDWCRAAARPGPLHDDGGRRQRWGHAGRSLRDLRRPDEV